MRCEHAKHHIDDYLDGVLDGALVADLEGHLDGCAECADRLAEAQVLRQALRDLPVPGPSRDLVAGARERAERGHRGRITALAGTAGLAASLLLALGAWLFQPAVAPGPTEQGPATVALTPGEADTVKLLVRSSRRVEGADLSIELPEGLELAGRPGQARLRWHADLEPGANLLELPVVLRDAREGRLKAAVRYGDRQQRLELSIVPRGSPESSRTPGLRQT
ncbi:MAG: anti-sigma factor family protein [Thiohalorhabdus sp.]|uniref:anti-sigma factor family protein n=1 Tax=Thiohalorhabdus sp. TaxID=3094134 RepID=UPI00397F31A2